MKWWQRLRFRMLDLGWTKRELSRRSGINYDSINKYLRGSVDKPRGEVLDRLAEAVGKDPRWLLFGETNIADAFSRSARGEINRGNADGDLLNINILDWNELPTYSERDFELRRFWTRIRAASSTIHKSTFGLPVRDDSMGPEFRLGEIIICDIEARHSPGDIVVVSLKQDNKRFFRRYKSLSPFEGPNARLLLNPLNAHYAPIEIDENNPGKIVGKIVRHIRMIGSDHDRV